MKLAKRFLFGAMAALALVGCSDDKLAPDSPGHGHGTGNDDSEGVYMNVNIKMPSGAYGRSYTSGDNESNDGTEVGKDIENNVTNVFLVIADPKDYTFIAWGEIPASSITLNTSGTGNVQYSNLARISKDQIAEYYDNPKYKDSDNRDISVFVFCNPTLTLRKVLEEEARQKDHTAEWTNETGYYDEINSNSEVIWSDNDFLMSNISIAIRTFPKTLDDWEPYTEKSKPFNLSGKNPDAGTECDNGTDAQRGAVEVERTAARFDFKDGSKNNNRYHVVFPDNMSKAERQDPANADKCLIDVQLTKMSLTNMNKKYYFLRRVSAEGWKDDAILCGPERPWYTNATGGNLNQEGNSIEPGNYVVNPIVDDALKFPIGYIPTDLTESPYPADTYFNYPFFNPQGQIDVPTINSWYTTEISMLTGNNNLDQKNEYHIWRYVIENTIPTVGLQKNGQSTGIIFKGRMIANDAGLTPTGNALNDKNLAQLHAMLNNTENILDETENNTFINPIIYKFESTNNDVQGMFASWPNVVEAAKAGACTPVWIPDNDHKDGGYWHLEVNRSNTLFHAVFGEGSCGSYTFQDPTDPENPEATITVEDPEKKVEENTPNYMWEKWRDAQNPDGGPYNPVSENALKALDAFRSVATANGFTLYQTSKDGSEGIGYYCYYNYWNRHNSNGKNSIMGPMEFAVVRNNVYKISVTDIDNIGHPRLTVNDPTPPTPNTDDEIDDVYIRVDVEVLPWVVRINNVEF